MEPFELDTGNTAWMLAAASLVLLMTPALAFFYGGMTRSQDRPQHDDDVASARSPSSASIWMLWGYSMTFGTNIAGGLIGNPFEYFALKGLHRRRQPDGRHRRAGHGRRRLPG